MCSCYCFILNSPFLAVTPSYSRRLHKYSNRGFAVCVPGLNQDFINDGLRFVASLKEGNKKISGTNGLLWLLSKERNNPFLQQREVPIFSGSF